MQTFLPFPDFENTARILDMRRLGKQRVETKQILQAIQNNTAWKNHPAVNMWRGCEYSLCVYGTMMCQEWLRRGYKDSLAQYFFDQIENTYHKTNIKLPWWIGNNDFHKSHQSNLLRKKFEYYNTYFIDVSPNLPYLWPSHIINEWHKIKRETI